jgi:cytochrome P450
MVLLSAPDAIRTIFRAGWDDICAGAANVAMQPIVGPQSLLLLDGVRHRNLRAIMTPSFHGAALRRYAEIVRSVASARISRWSVGERFSLHAELQAIALEAILEAAVGRDEASVRERLRKALLRLLRLMARSFDRVSVAEHKGLSFKTLLARSRRQVDLLLSEEMNQRRRRAGATQFDILDVLLDVRTEAGEHLSDAEIRDQVVTLLIAGHETTATSLAWLFQRVLADGGVKSAIEREVKAAGRRCNHSLRRVQDTPYLDATIKETLRLHPVFPVIGRRLRKPITVEGFELPAGVVAAPCIYLAHRSPDSWWEPESFRPERFIGRVPSQYQYLPFGGGDRRCLGMAFAICEMRGIAREILSRVELVAASDVSRVVRRNVALAPVGGVPVVAKRIGTGFRSEAL